MQGTIFPLPCRPGACGVGGGREAQPWGGPGGEESGEEDTRVETGAFWERDIYSILPHGYSNPKGAFWGPSRAFL